MKRIKSKLPKKLGALVRLAIADLRQVAKDSRYAVDMHSWHGRPYEAVCHVCFAGAVMARSLATPHNLSIGPGALANSSRISQKDERRLYALDALRLGSIWLGVYRLCKGKITPLPTGCPETITVVPYDVDPKQFFRDMNKVARTLEKFNL